MKKVSKDRENMCVKGEVWGKRICSRNKVATEFKYEILKNITE